MRLAAPILLEMHGLGETSSQTTVFQRLYLCFVIV